MRQGHLVSGILGSCIGQVHLVRGILVEFIGLL